MPLEWLSSSREPDLPDLIARKKYGRAIEVVTAQFERHPPTMTARLQLADLLVLAGRGAEAVPVFKRLADDFAADGFVAKAIAILKRVERIAPGENVGERLAHLVKEQRRIVVRDELPRTVSLRPNLPIFGMEEIEDEPILGADNEPSLEPEPNDSAAAGATGTDLEIREIEEIPESATPEPDELLDAEIELVADDSEEAAAPLAAPDPDAEPAAEVEPRGGGEEKDGAADGPVSERIRNVFRRFLATLPGSEAAGASENGDDAEASIEVEADELAASEPETEADTDSDAEPGTITEEIFEDQLLDLVHQAIVQPRADAPGGNAVHVPAHERLIATPLFGDLDEEELLAVVERLTLRTFAPGDVILTEGELVPPSLFIVSTGSVRVFVRNPTGRNVQIKRLGEGEFFGEISGISGHPRTATVTAAERCELLEFDKPALDAVAKRHPHVRERLEELFVQRAGSPEVAAVRAVALGDKETQLAANEILSTYFGAASWNPRVRLRLAKLLVESDKPDDAVPILIGLAHELTRGGHTEKAIAVIKKVEQIQQRHIKTLNLAPLLIATGTSDDREATKRRTDTDGDDAFQTWVVDVVRKRVAQESSRPRDTSASAREAGFRSGLRTSPLFEGFSEDELLALVRGFRLRHVEPGDIVVTEGESGHGLFILSQGSVRVFIRDPMGHDVELCDLADGAFFGEMSTLSGKPRSASVVATRACDLLELDRDALDALAANHPRVRRVLDEFIAARRESHQAARIRGIATPPEVDC